MGLISFLGIDSRLHLVDKLAEIQPTELFCCCSLYDSDVRRVIARGEVTGLNVQEL